LSDSLSELRVQFEKWLELKMKNLHGVSNELHAAMSYGLLDGGKRLRASLMFATGKALGLNPEALFDAACAIEAVHAYSLVHDDLPSMDNDVLRRGKPTCHVKFGEAMALLAGDALQTTAFQWLAESTLQTPLVRLEQVRILAQASGAQGMANGQSIDLTHVGKSMDLDQLTHMHARKTGDLIAASVRLAYCAKEYSTEGLSSDTKVNLEQFAKALGLAYQVIDDILDVEASSEVLGKTSGKDALSNKPTMVSLMGLQEAKNLLNTLEQQALQACKHFDEESRSHLVLLTEWITKRKS
jgi:farnesyl diphosphate synthase